MSTPSSVDWDEFEAQLNAYCKEEAEEDAKKLPESELESKEQRIERLKKAKFDDALKFKTVLKYGWHALLSHCKEHIPKAYEQSSFYLRLSNDLWDRSFADDPAKKKDVIGNIARDFEWPDELMVQLYTAATEIYKAKKFDDAAAAFTALIAWDNSNADYWIGLGLTRQMGFKDYTRACDSYFRAMDLAPDNPYVYVYYAECLSKLGEDLVVLKHFLDLALVKMNNCDEIDDLRAYCVALKIKLESNLK